tara:strand:+ start:1224 stop:1526 length:303 start_codon:yes stop_codon:yes gene_type:complete
MKLSEITQKPQLIEVLLDDTEIVEEFGEELIFYTWDRQPLEIFMQLANLTVDADNNNGIIDIVRKLILDNKGKEIITPNNVLPTKVLMKAIAKVTELLGK